MALPTVEARGCWTSSEQLLANAVANCPETWAFLGVASEALAAKGNLFIDSMPPPRNDEEYDSKEYFDRIFPAIIIATPGDDSETFRLFRRSSPNDFGAIGVLEIRFLRLPNPRETIENEERRFKNHVGVILEELTDRGDAEGFLHMQDMSVQDYGREPQEGEDALGELQVAVVQVPWGVPEGGGEE